MTDFISEANAEAKLRFGRELSADELAAELARHGKEARIQHLKNLDTADSYTTPREAARRHVYERALRATHARLMSIQR
jgi:hypothetical protein